VDSLALCQRRGGVVDFVRSLMSGCVGPPVEGESGRTLFDMLTVGIIPGRSVEGESRDAVALCSFDGATQNVAAIRLGATSLWRVCCRSSGGETG